MYSSAIDPSSDDASGELKRAILDIANIKQLHWSGYN
jgi:hypothetical protein